MPNNTPKTLWISRMGLLLALTLALQVVGLPQPVTGPAVNAILLLSVLLVGWKSATGIGVITPLFALIRGQLPPVLAPMVPFIMLGNAVLVLSFTALWRFRKIRSEMPRFVLGVGLAAILKTAWLWMAAVWTVPVILGKQIPHTVVTAMTLPQFVTAVLGGMITWIAYSVLIKRSVPVKREL